LPTANQRAKGETYGLGARILAYITGTVDQELLLRNEYMVAENQMLKAQGTAEAFGRRASAGRRALWNVLLRPVSKPLGPKRGAGKLV
jgi:hypothetical protein